MPNTLLLDGKYTRGFYTKRARVNYPFLVNGDYSTVTVERDWIQSASVYFPGKQGVDRDPVYSTAYLILETQPEPTGIGDLVRTTRTFSIVPASHSDPGSLFITKPDVPGTFPQVFGDYRLFQPVSTVASYDSYLAKTVISDSGIPGALYPSGGTYTLTFAGSTTGALNYNDSNATVQTALNALTSVSNRGNVVVSGSYNSAGGLTVTFNAYAAATMDTSLITADGSGAFYSDIYTNVSGYLQTFFVRPGFGAVNISGGTFTITMFGQTTAAIAYNATAATVQAALNALSEVQTKRGGVTVTTAPIPLSSGPLYFPTILAQNYGDGARYISFSIQFTNAVITSNVASLTPAGSTVTASLSSSAGTTGQIQTIAYSAGTTAVRSIGATAHGITAGTSLFIKADGAYYQYSGSFTAPNDNLVQLLPAPGTIGATATAITEIGKRTVQGYTPGTALTRISRVTTFYLPGVTTGITTAADIPLPTYQGDPTALLTAIFAQSTSINYQVGELERWLNSPILMRTVTTINATQL